MPTEEQLTPKLKSKTRKYRKSTWVITKKEDWEDIVCPKCMANIHRRFGGEWVYIEKGRAQKRKEIIERIDRLIKDGYTRKEIVQTMQSIDGMKPALTVYYYIRTYFPKAFKDRK